MNPTSHNRVTGFPLLSPTQPNKGKNNITVNAAYFTSIELIQRAGICCNLNMKTINTAIMIFLRYFQNNDIIDSKYSVNDICRCCLFSAAKIEEMPCRIRDIMNATFKITFPNTKLLVPNTSEWHKWKTSLIELEGIVLNEINYALNAVQPHEFVLHQCNELKTSTSIAKLAWSICNDCMYSRHIMLRFEPHYISAAAIYVAAQFLASTIHCKQDNEIKEEYSPNHGSNDGTKESHWWRRFDIEDNIVYSISMLIIDLYESPFARFQCEDNNKIKNDQDEDDEEDEDEDDDLDIKTPSPKHRLPVISDKDSKQEMDEDNDIQM